MKLSVKGIQKSFQNRLILKGITYEFSGPGLYLITGRSGGGKTTLLNIIAGYERMDEGTLEYDGSSTISTMFQNYELIDLLTIEENILLYPRLHNLDCEREFYHHMIDQLGLHDLLHQYPSELSQGQKQRVNVARALCVASDVILCDEPTEALDLESAEQVISLLVEFAKEKIVIVVTHDSHVMEISQATILMLKNGQLQELQSTSIKGCDSSNKQAEQSLNKHAVQVCVNQIVKQKTKVQICLLSLCVGIVFSFALIYGFIFVQEPIEGLVNRNQIYVEGQSLTLSNSDAEVEKIPLFQNETFNGLVFELHVYPYPKQACEVAAIAMSQPSNDGIVLNQVAAQYYEQKLQIQEHELLGNTIDLMMKETDIYIPFTIQGIVLEETEIAQLYYDADYLAEVLQEKGLQKGSGKVSLYEVLPVISQRKALYEKLQAKKNYYVYNSEYEQLESKQRESDSYFPYFTMIFVAALLIQFVYVINQALHDWKLCRSSLMILLSVHIDESLLQRCYIKNKARLLLIQFCCMSVLAVLCHTAFPAFPINYVFLYLILFYGIFLLSILHCGRTLKKQVLASFFKEDKDHRFE